MDIIIRVLAVASKFIYVGVVSLCLTDLIQPKGGFLLIFIVINCLFFNMVEEDAKTQLVDIRKAGLLGLGLCIISRYDFLTFILQAIISFLIYRLCWIFTSRRISQDIADISELGQEKDSGGANKIAFIPCLAAALFLFILLVIYDPNMFLLFETLTKTSDNLIFHYWIHNQVQLLVILFIYLFIEFLHWYFYRRKHIMAGGIGMGDVLVLPCFTAFLGIPVFLIVFIISIFCAAVVVIIKKYFIRRDYINDSGIHVSTQRKI